MNKHFSISVFEYKSEADFLNEAYLQIKNERPRYSIRAWARDLKSKNPTTISRVLSGERGTPKKLVANIAESLEMTAEEIAYFEVLVYGREKISDKSLEIIRRALNHGTPRRGS